MSDKINSGIKCDAEKCTYHTKDNCCTAECIKVGYSDACTSNETACETFKEKCC